MVVHWPSPRLPIIKSAFIRLNKDFYQNSGDVVQSDVPLVLMPVVGCWGDSKKLTILSHSPLGGAGGIAAMVRLAVSTARPFYRSEAPGGA